LAVPGVGFLNHEGHKGPGVGIMRGAEHETDACLGFSAALHSGERSEDIGAFEFLEFFVPFVPLWFKQNRRNNTSR
jgi:hypothetical protein